MANWKMNPVNLAEAEKMFLEIKKLAGRAQNVQTVVCPPFVFLSPMSKLVSGHRAVLGAQDVFYERNGAYTGEVSPSQLLGLGVNYVILGHSERREMGETDAFVGRKVGTALKDGLVTILCVGERVRDDAGVFLDTIKSQLEVSLADIPRRYFLNLVVVYEPLWTISTHASGTESPEDMLQMSIFIRKTLGNLCGKDIAVKIPILHGGSVDETNIAGYISRGGVNGALVGKASLRPEIFGKIIKIANELQLEDWRA